MPFNRELSLKQLLKAVEQGLLPFELVKSVESRLPLLSKAIERVEKASSLQYPPVEISPILKVLHFPSVEFMASAVYAYLDLLERSTGEYQLAVVFSAPLVLYAKEETLAACAAHEFLHYVYFTLKLYEAKYFDLSIQSVVAPEVYEAFDDQSLVNPIEWLQGDQELIQLLQEVFNGSIHDNALEEATTTQWIEQGLPVLNIAADEHKLRVPISALESIQLDQKVLEYAKSKGLLSL